MINNRLFQVAMDPRRHQQLGGVAIDVGDMSNSAMNQMMLAVAAALDPGVVTFTHQYDPDLATAWLAECFRFSYDEINRMHSQTQALTVANVWTAFGNYFKALNLRPYGLQKFRRVCAQAWGGPPVGPTDESQSRTIARDERPWMNWDWPGQWRLDAAQQFGGGSIEPRSVIFGSQNDNDELGADVNVGCTTANTATNANCPWPGEVHRIWLQNNGTVQTPRIWQPFECADGGVTDSDNTDMDSTNDGTGDDPSQQGFWNWRAGAWEDSDPAVGRRRFFVLAPLLWYWRMLRAPFPGLRLEDGGADVSLCEWLWRLGPVEVLRTAKRDVVNKNALMLRARGRERLSQILGDAELREGQVVEQERGDVRQIGNVLIGAAGSVLSIGGPVGIVGGAVLGIAGAVLAFAPGLLVTELITIDLFGRRMAVIEVYAQMESGAAIAYLEAVAPPTSLLRADDPHLPGPPPPQPDSPRPNDAQVTTVPLTIIIPGPELDQAPPAEVIGPAKRGPSTAAVLTGAAVALLAGVAAHKVLSSK